MIGDRASTLRDLYRRLDDLRSVAERVAQVSETRQALEALEGPARHGAAALGLIRARIDPERREALARDLAGVAALVRRSEVQFAGNRRQVQSLKQAENKLTATQAAIDEAWRGYAERQVSGLRDLRVIVLPLLPEQAAELQAALGSVERRGQTAPRTEEELRAFDAALEGARGVAAALEGLPGAVRAFLARVAVGQATLADVTPEALSWLAGHGHLGRFAVRPTGASPPGSATGVAS